MSDATTTTFSRRKKGIQTAGKPPAVVDTATHPTEFTHTPDAHAQKGSVQTPSEASKHTIPARWRRKGSAWHRQHTARQSYLDSLKAHFAEVDAFELAVETPTPHRSTAEDTLQQQMRPMSLGLSRRTSTGVRPRSSSLSAGGLATPSPSRLRLGTRTSLAPLPEHGEISLPSQSKETCQRENQHQRVASLVRESKHSQARRSFSRKFEKLSIGLSDALQWLARRGSLPAAAIPAAQEEGGVHKGASVPEESPKKPLEHGTSIATTEPEQAGIFAIEENNKTVQGTSKFVSSANLVAKSPQHDAQLGLDVSALEDALATKLDLQDQSEPSNVALEYSPTLSSATSSELPPMQQLLRMCGQEEDDQLIPPMDALLGRHVDLTKLKKIGEGTFGEAFRAGSVVLKVVPMEGGTLINGEPQKRAEEILAEVAITLTLSRLRGGPLAGVQPADENSPFSLADCANFTKANVTTGFVETYGVGVCRGRYAPVLCKEWHRWDKVHGSENDSVDIFGDEQLYVVFVVADGGLDLEHFEPHTLEELRSVLLQATLTLAVAEEACEFEHRDLHWGNLLINRDGTETIDYRLRGVDLRVRTAGVRVTLIDFTLSRLVTADGDVAYCDLTSDPEIFRGPKGDPQAETYRRMQKITRGNWQRHEPMTNVLWLRYLVETILAHKIPAGCTSDDKLALRNFKKEATGADSAKELVWADLFAGLWTTEPPDCRAQMMVARH